MSTRRESREEKSRIGDIDAMAKSLMPSQTRGDGGYIYNKIKDQNNGILEHEKTYDLGGSTYMYDKETDVFKVIRQKGLSDVFKDSVNQKIEHISLRRLQQEVDSYRAVQQLMNRRKPVVEAIPVETVPGEIVSSEPELEPEPETKPGATDLLAEQMQLGREAGYPDLPMRPGEDMGAYFRRLKEHYKRLKKQESNRRTQGCCGSRPSGRNKSKAGMKKKKKKQTRRRKPKPTNKRKPKQTRRYKKMKH